jgi:hypothetical protein
MQSPTREFRFICRPSGGYIEGRVVKLKYIMPDFMGSGWFTMEPISETGYYYLDHVFAEDGKHIIEIRVDGVYHHSDTLTIGGFACPGLVRYEGGGA